MCAGSPECDHTAPKERGRSTAGTDDSEYANDLLGTFLVLEARILELILKCRESISFLIRQRKNNLIDYTQASAVHRLLNS